MPKSVNKELLRLSKLYYGWRIDKPFYETNKNKIERLIRAFLKDGIVLSLLKVKIIDTDGFFMSEEDNLSLKM